MNASDTNDAFGNWLAERTRTLDLVELATVSGVSYSHLRNIVKGRRGAGLEIVRKLLRALKLSTEDTEAGFAAAGFPGASLEGPRTSVSASAGVGISVSVGTKPNDYAVRVRYLRITPELYRLHFLVQQKGSAVEHDVAFTVCWDQTPQQEMKIAASASPAEVFLPPGEYRFAFTIGAPLQLSCALELELSE